MNWKSALLVLGLTISSMLVDAQSGTGFGRFYYQGGNPGAPAVFGSCGRKHSDSDVIIGAPQGIMKASCRKTVEITNLGGTKGPVGKKIRAKVEDACVGCAPTDLDLSVEVFKQLTNGDFGAGRVKISWRIV